MLAVPSRGHWVALVAAAAAWVEGRKSGAAMMRVLSYDCLCECHLDDGQADHLYRMSQSPLWDRLKPQQAGRLDNKFGLQ
jgi:hypothetical protein